MEKKGYVAGMIFQFIALSMPAAYCQDMEPKQSNAAALEQKHQEALLLYRQNKADAALLILDELHRAHPEEAGYLYDYMSIASWSGRHDLAIAAVGLNPDIAPAYVLEALAASQRHAKQYDASLITYDLVVKRFPGKVEAQVGMAHTQIDARRYREAEIQLSVLQKQHPGRMDVMECALRLSDSVKRPIHTLVDAERILEINPGNAFALRMRFFALRKLGVPHLAARLTPASILSEAEKIAVERDRLAFELRWARIGADRPEPGSRWKEMDAVIARLEEVCGLAEAEGSASEVVRGGCGDLVAALSDRRRMPEALALYEKMVDKQWPVQPYVKMAAATAYLEERQPEKARDLFAAALLADPNNVAGRTGYIYALLESGQYKDADRQADQLAADTNEWLNPKFPAIREPNPAYSRAQLTSALIRSYTNRLAEAESSLQLLASRAPNNAEIRHALAATHNSRGWPRRAEKDLKWLHAAQPPNVWTKIGLFENRMAAGDFRGAELQLNDAILLEPEEKFVQKVQRGWGTHNLRELAVETTFGRSTDGGVTPNGSREFLVDARVYSSPIGYNWRTFLHAQFARTEFPALPASRNAAGGGVEYRSRNFSATGEARNVGNSGAGFALGAGYRPDDHWHFDGSAESKSLSAPVRAYADRISASNYQLGGGYRWHESRDVGLTVGQMNFSDGNRRNSAGASWMEGLLRGATYTLDTTVEYYASRNSSHSTLINYFNPASDRHVGISLKNEWLQFHRYEKSLKHILIVGAGNYAQQGYASGGVTNIKYEQLYSFSDRLKLRYGIGRTVHPYDGIRVSVDAVTFGAGWRF